MLKITYEAKRDDIFVRDLIALANKMSAGYGTYSKEYNDFLEAYNKRLDEAFREGRAFERSYKPEDD